MRNLTAFRSKGDAYGEVPLHGLLQGPDQNMLGVSFVVFLVVAATGAAVWARFSWRSLCLAAGALELLGFVLLGLPGAAFLEAIQPLMQRLGYPTLSGDAAWPAAILMSLLWPVALVPAYIAGRSLHAGNGLRGLLALAVLVLTCLVVGFLVYGLIV
jgi:hypothetical protein